MIKTIHGKVHGRTIELEAYLRPKMVEFVANLRGTHMGPSSH